MLQHANRILHHVNNMQMYIINVLKHASDM